MKTKIDKMQVVAHNKKLQHLLSKANAKLRTIKVEENTTAQDDIKYINAYLHKISINAAHYVFDKEACGKKIISNELDELIFDLDKVIKLQLSRSIHQSIILETKEIRKNFEYWSTVPTKALLQVIKKEHYLTLLLEEYFEMDMKWRTTVVTLIARFAQCSISFLNIDDYMDKSIEHTDIATIKYIMQRVIGIQLMAATHCAEIWAVNKEHTWGARGIKFWMVAINLSKIIGNKEQVAKLEEQILGMQKRMQSESESSTLVASKSAKDVKLLSLDDLISGNDY